MARTFTARRIAGLEPAIAAMADELLEGAVAFPRLLRRFPKIAAAAEPTRRDRLLLRGFDTLPVTVA